MAKEQDIQTSIINYISSIGGLAIKQNQIGIYATAGVPDIIACLKGKFIGIEVKRPGEKPTKIQESYIKTINDIGGLAFWADNLDDVKEKLKELST